MAIVCVHPFENASLRPAAMHAMTTHTPLGESLRVRFARF
jgi:hypothetical protein